MAKDTIHMVHAPFDEKDPNVQLLLLAQRLTIIVKEKEELELAMRLQDTRILKLEAALEKGNGLDHETISWLRKADKDKLLRIDDAIQFMSNAEFMSKWTWRGIAGFIALSGGFFAAFKFWKGG